MKKILGIFFISLLLSVNAYAKEEFEKAKKKLLN